MLRAGQGGGAGAAIGVQGTVADLQGHSRVRAAPPSVWFCPQREESAVGPLPPHAAPWACDPPHPRGLVSKATVGQTEVTGGGPARQGPSMQGTAKCLVSSSQDGREPADYGGEGLNG